MQDKILNVRNSLRQIYNSILILHKAVVNDISPKEPYQIEGYQIEDLLAILIDKFENEILVFDDFIDDFYNLYIKKEK